MLSYQIATPFGLAFKALHGLVSLISFFLPLSLVGTWPLHLNIFYSLLLSHASLQVLMCLLFLCSGNPSFLQTSPILQVSVQVLLFLTILSDLLNSLTEVVWFTGKVWGSRARVPGSNPALEMWIFLPSLDHTSISKKIGEIKVVKRIKVEKPCESIVKLVW